MCCTRLRLLLVAAAILLAACGGGGSDAPPPVASGDEPYADNAVYSSAGGASLANAVEGAATTHHTMRLGGRQIDYTAKAGHLIARSGGSGAAQASFFYVAYTADGLDAAKRPLTFFYNGGPGSASVWLHLGSFGPKRLATGMPGTSAPRPFPLVDNAESLLDVTDLVFVDAVGSGLSQAVAPRTNRAFWGVDADAAVFRDFILRYVRAHGRQASPKFLFGESYGTTRSAVLAPLLQAAGVSLAGVVLQSSVLDYNSNCDGFEPPLVSCAGYLPAYAATGAHHALLAAAPGDIDAYMLQMRDYTATRYAPAVDALLAAGTAPPVVMPDELAGRTGLAAARWRAKFNMPPGSYRAGLMPGTMIGRYDARVAVPVGDPLARDGDPSSTVLDASFAGAMRSLLRDELRYTHRGTYVLFGSAIYNWNFGHDGEAVPDTLPDLAAALAQNPALRVLAVSGLHDLATPFHQTELDLARLGHEPRVEVRNYEGGHMTYLDDRSRVRQRADLLAFYRQAAPGLVVAGKSSARAAAVRPPMTQAPVVPAAADEAVALQVPVRDPWLPPHLRTAPRAAATQGDELRAQARAKLRALEDDSSRR